MLQSKNELWVGWPAAPGRTATAARCIPADARFFKGWDTPFFPAWDFGYGCRMVSTMYAGANPCNPIYWKVQGKKAAKKSPGVSAGSRTLGIILILPALGLGFLTIIVPLIYTAGVSPTKYNFLLPPQFIGLANYTALLSAPNLTAVAGLQKGGTPFNIVWSLALPQWIIGLLIYIPLQIIYLDRLEVR